MRYLSAISSRYGALAVQFIIVLLVANRLPQADAGLYFVAFGIVATLFCLVGLGLPDGLVISFGRAISQGRTTAVRDALRRSLLWGGLSALLLFGGGATLAISLGNDVSYSVMTALWGMLYGMVFVAAQGLIALRSAALGSFFFYSATNLFFLFTSVPYLLLSAVPTLQGLMGMTLLASTCAASSAIVTLWRKARPYRGTDRADLAPPVRAGAVIAVSRMLQSGIYWVPVWIATLLLGSTEAAVIATAGRLLIAVTAVIAALRFSVRPAIVAAEVEGDWSAIERLGRRISMATTVFTLTAMLGLWLIGKPVLGVLLGADYAAAWGVLMVLLIGALGESFGGPVDEVLKMTGDGQVVLRGLIVTVLLEATLAGLLAGQGIIAIAAAQALAFVGLYAYQVYRLSCLRGIRIMPLPPAKAQIRDHK